MIRFLLPVENRSAVGSHRKYGELAEWSKAHDWKSCLRVTVTRVQIPNSPPERPRTPENIVFSGVLPFPGEVSHVKNFLINRKNVAIVAENSKKFHKTDYSPLFIIFENVAENVAELQNDPLKSSKNDR